MVSTPAYTQTPNLKQVQVATANTNRDGATGTYSAALAFGASGGLVDWIYFKAAGSTAAGVLRIFFSPDAGTTWRLLDEVTAAGVTASGTTPSEALLWTPQGGVPLNMPINGQLRFNVNNAETWNVFVQEGDY